MHLCQSVAKTRAAKKQGYRTQLGNKLTRPSRRSFRMDRFPCVLRVC
jgi:hypothetical protein